jgi:hypothetical protein
MPDGFSVVVIDHGRLTFYRRFRHEETNADPPALYIKECLEQFAFLFPRSAIDCVLLGGHLPESEKLKNWTEELSRCPCEFISPLSSNRVSSRKNRMAIDDAVLGPYWPSLGLVYGEVRPWA